MKLGNIEGGPTMWNGMHITQAYFKDDSRYRFWTFTRRGTDYVLAQCIEGKWWHIPLSNGDPNVLGPYDFEQAMFLARLCS